MGLLSWVAQLYRTLCPTLRFSRMAHTTSTLIWEALT